MNRRDLLHLLGATAAVPLLGPLSPERRLAVGRDLHRRLGQSLRVLSAHQDATVTRIAELIIPETDTPGAAAVGVNRFIDLLLAEWYDEDDRDSLLAGLAAIDARSRRLHGAPFVDMPDDQQTALLRMLDSGGGDGSAEDAFATLKDLTVYGYFTSEVVIKDVLRTPVIPGRFDGCVPI